MILFSPLSAEIRRVMDRIPVLIDELFPLPGRFRAGLPRDVAELSRLLTSGRGDRSESYLGKPPLLSAYLRYFLPWNLYRLCRLLPALPLSFSDGDALTDLGSGPLTVPLALWISRPELRGVPLEFRCLDRTGAALDAGKKLFYALAGNASPWVIKTIHASLGAPVHGPKAALVSAVNLFNELCWDIPHTNSRALVRVADKNARLLSALSAETGAILVVEPGIPRSGEFITALRTSLHAHQRSPRSPCPHTGPCPFPGGNGAPPGGKSKWCHFAFETQDAPPSLLKLSALAGLPKERGTLSFLLAGPSEKEPATGNTAGSTGKEQPGIAREALPVRIISDPFPVSQGLYGRYGCSTKGIILVTGEKAPIEQQESGTLREFILPSPEKRDPKSGGVIVRS
ncbi:MAG: rRNA methyltransferase [Treponema sp.]|jgi:hypothetical protein|nr:rRNA methyltransferase [Treponema sp.]